MSIEKKAARGVAWNMATSVGARVVQLAGTLILTKFIAPADYGEVSAAVICVQAANAFTSFAIGQYIIAHRSPPKVAFQGAILHFFVGLAAVLVVFFTRSHLGVMLEAPAMDKYIPGLAVALMLDRARHIPERILVRDLRFRSVAIINSVGELTFTATALALAPRFGGFAIVGGGIVRSSLSFILFMVIAPRNEWLVPSKLEKDVVRSIFSYGGPVVFGALADRASSTWDNLIVLRFFGARLMGCYALSYSLAETPLTYVAERMGDVLMPAFSKMEPEERPAAVIRAAGLMSLVVAPLGVGLGAVAPTLVHAFFDARWAEMASILMVLSVMTVIQPVPWSAVAYLQAEKLTRLLMIMSIGRAILLLSLVALLGWLGGVVWACVGVGLGFAGYSIATVIFTARVTPLRAIPYFVSVLRPLIACVPMFGSVAFLHPFLKGIPVGLALAVEIAVGGIVYVVSAFVFAGPSVRELIGFARGRREKR